MPRKKRALEEFNGNAATNTCKQKSAKRSSATNKRHASNDTVGTPYKQSTDASADSIEVPDRQLPNIEDLNSLTPGDIVRLWLTDECIQDWTKQLNSFASQHPDIATNGRHIDEEPPKISGSEQETEYELQREEAPEHKPVPLRPWRDVSTPEMEVFIVYMHQYAPLCRRLGQWFSKSVDHPYHSLLECMTLDRFEQILRCAGCIGVDASNRINVYPGAILDRGSPDFPYLNKCVDKAFELFKTDGPPPKKKTFARNKRAWKDDFMLKVERNFVRKVRE